MSLAGAKPQMSRQLELPLEGRGEAPRVQRSEEAPAAAKGNGDSGTGGLLEAVLSRPNLLAALRRVRSNKGSPGSDGMTVEELPIWLREHWPEVRERLLAGTYQPAAVRRQMIPKRGGGMGDMY